MSIMILSIDELFDWLLIMNQTVNLNWICQNSFYSSASKNCNLLIKNGVIETFIETVMHKDRVLKSREKVKNIINKNGVVKYLLQLHKKGEM